MGVSRQNVFNHRHHDRVPLMPTKPAPKPPQSSPSDESLSGIPTRLRQFFIGIGVPVKSHTHKDDVMHKDKYEMRCGIKQLMHWDSANSVYRPYNSVDMAPSTPLEKPSLLKKIRHAVTQ